MRDLKADLEICNNATPGPWKCLDDTPVDTEWASIFPQDLDFVMNAREGWPHAIERAIKAEAKNAKLRAVVEAAREFISSTGCNPKECGKCDPKYIGFCRWSGIGQALAELDEEDTHD